MFLSVEEEKKEMKDRDTVGLDYTEVSFNRIGNSNPNQIKCD